MIQLVKERVRVLVKVRVRVLEDHLLGRVLERVAQDFAGKGEEEQGLAC